MLPGPENALHYASRAVLIRQVMKKKKIKAKLDKTKKKLSKTQSRLEAMTNELEIVRKTLAAEGTEAVDGIGEPGRTANNGASLPGDVVH